MIKNVILDIGGVLVDFAWKKTMEEMGFSKDCVRTLGDKLINGGIWDEFDLGVMTEDEVLDLASREIPEYEKEIRYFWENSIQTIRPYDYCEKWVREMKDKGLNVYLLTNYPDTLFKNSVKCGFPFYPYIDGEVVSSRVKVSKPSEGIYKALFDKYSLNPDECVFFDDRPVNVNAAKVLGVHAFVFEGYEKALDELESLL